MKHEIIFFTFKIIFSLFLYFDYNKMCYPLKFPRAFILMICSNHRYSCIDGLAFECPPIHVFYCVVSIMRVIEYHEPETCVWKEFVEVQKRNNVESKTCGNKKMTFHSKFGVENWII